jgi:hypothetical protein
MGFLLAYLPPLIILDAGFAPWEISLLASFLHLSLSWQLVIIEESIQHNSIIHFPSLFLSFGVGMHYLDLPLFLTSRISLLLLNTY